MTSPISVKTLAPAWSVSKPAKTGVATPALTGNQRLFPIKFLIFPMTVKQIR